MLSRPSRLLDRHLPLYRGQSFNPAPATHRQGSALRGINGGSSNSPVRPFPSPVAARMERAALGLYPELRTPPTKSRRRTSRWGQAIEHGPGTTRSTSHQSNLQSCSSLTTCDLASHDERQKSSGALPGCRFPIPRTEAMPRVTSGSAALREGQQSPVDLVLCAFCVNDVTGPTVVAGSLAQRRRRSGSCSAVSLATASGLGRV